VTFLCAPLSSGADVGAVADLGSGALPLCDPVSTVRRNGGLIWKGYPRMAGFQSNRVAKVVSRIPFFLLLFAIFHFLLGIGRGTISLLFTFYFVVGFPDSFTTSDGTSHKLAKALMAQTGVSPFRPPVLIR